MNKMYVILSLESYKEACTILLRKVLNISKISCDNWLVIVVIDYSN